MSRRWPVNAALLTVLWLFVRGVARTGDVTLAGFGVNVVEEVVVGLVVAVPLAYFTRNLYTGEVPVARGLRTVPYALVYLGLFLYELVTANLEVAYRVLAPSMPIDPDVYEVPLRVETDIAITTIANSISLTPGTLSMDYDADRNAIYVHTLAGRNRDAVVEPIRRWEDYALVIFGERRSPGDPVPRRPIGGPYERESPPTSTDSRETADRGGEG